MINDTEKALKRVRRRSLDENLNIRSMQIAKTRLGEILSTAGMFVQDDCASRSQEPGHNAHQHHQSDKLK